MFGAKTEAKTIGDKAVTARSPCLGDSKSARLVRRTELEAGKRRRGPMSFPLTRNVSRANFFQRNSIRN